MRTLVTGAAGFIGYHVAERLLIQGRRILGIDNLNHYYDPGLKRARLARLAVYPNFEFRLLDIADRGGVEELFEKEEFGLAIHLAAQAGVRYSIKNPYACAASNLTGFLHILEGCRRADVRHLIYASSSSVYGGNSKTPFTVEDRVDSPVSLYAATKKANELMAHCYTHLYAIPTTGLRFFTVYGPWGRPDMAPFRFARAIARGGRIDVYNYGRMQRDFTYIDDVVESVLRVEAKEPAGYRLFNVGNSHPIGLMEFIGALEHSFGRKARKRFLPLQPGDAISTHAGVEELFRFTGFRPSTPVSAGVERFVNWYREYYGDQQYDHAKYDRAAHRRTVLRAS